MNRSAQNDKTNDTPETAEPVDKPRSPGFRRRTYEIIFGHNTPEGKSFDVILLWVILFSVLVVMLESVASIEQQYGFFLRITEWILTILFTVEYVLRLTCNRKPAKYAFSFFGLVDLMSILPTYLSLVFAGSQYFAVIRGLRLLRAFRVLKMTQYLGEAEVLSNALKASRAKISVFMLTVLSLVTIAGALMHLIEGPESGFTSIPKSMYWAIVTLTTVGYGDIAPATVVGQTLAAFLMIMGYAIIAVPTGIVSVELSQANNDAKAKADANRSSVTKVEVGNIIEDALGKTNVSLNETKCEAIHSKTNSKEHDSDATYCKYCGDLLEA